VIGMRLISASSSRRSFRALCCFAGARAGSATGVLLETGHPSRRHETKVHWQAKEKTSAQKTHPTSRLGSAACGKRSRSRPVLHEEGRFGCGHRSFSRRHDSPNRLCHPFRFLAEAQEKKGLKNKPSILPAYLDLYPTPRTATKCARKSTSSTRKSKKKGQAEGVAATNDGRRLGSHQALLRGREKHGLDRRS